jgi:hypothetical protein
LHGHELPLQKHWSQPFNQEARINWLDTYPEYDCKAKPLVQNLIADVNSNQINKDPFLFISDPDPKIDLYRFLMCLRSGF